MAATVDATQRRGEEPCRRLHRRIHSHHEGMPTAVVATQRSSAEPADLHRGGHHGLTTAVTRSRVGGAELLARVVEGDGPAGGGAGATPVAGGVVGGGEGEPRG